MRSRAAEPRGIEYGRTISSSIVVASEEGYGVRPAIMAVNMKQCPAEKKRVPLPAVCHENSRIMYVSPSSRICSGSAMMGSETAMSVVRPQAKSRNKVGTVAHLSRVEQQLRPSSCVG